MSKLEVVILTTLSVALVLFLLFGIYKNLEREQKCIKLPEYKSMYKECSINGGEYCGSTVLSILESEGKCK